mmetsp:Transcript_83680/g.150966  ORF Transcript_83680/g.150966 Transcript_83680/m.150966 type:complete len:107 (+) Transcript_83680:964-1284(+)
MDRGASFRAPQICCSISNGFWYVSGGGGGGLLPIPRSSGSAPKPNSKAKRDAAEQAACRRQHNFGQDMFIAGTLRNVWFHCSFSGGISGGIKLVQQKIQTPTHKSV